MKGVSMAAKKKKKKAKKKKRVTHPLRARDPRPQPKKKKEKVEDAFETENFGEEELTGTTEDFDDDEQMTLF